MSSHGWFQRQAELADESISQRPSWIKESYSTINSSALRSSSEGDGLRIHISNQVNERKK